jgi:hypothetical protein
VTTLSSHIGNYQNNVNNQHRFLHFENYCGNASQGSCASSSVYYDDIYVQTGTQARVELCAESTWAGKKHCEIQVPSDWSDNSVTLAANQGSFTNGQQAYLYVIDSSGALNSSGYPVTIGSGGGTPPPTDTTPPAAPTGLKVQ